MFMKTRDFASVEALWHLRYHGYPETMWIASKEAEVRSLAVKNTVKTLKQKNSQEIT
jgi:hypothetical protein